jgi:hypothetical protein
MTRTLALVVAGAAALMVVGCGDDDDAAESQATTTASGAADSQAATTASDAADPDAQAYVDAMIESFDDSDPDELQIDREQAQCLAPRWVEAIGPDRLAEAGIEPEDFSSDQDVDLSTTGMSEDDANEMYDAFAACGIEVKTLFVESMATDRDLSEEDARCLQEAFPDDLLRRILVTTFVEGEEALDQDEELTGEMFGVFAECPGVADDDG